MLHALISLRRVVLAGAALISLVVAVPSAFAEAPAAAGGGLVAAPLNDAFSAAQLLNGEVGEVASTSKDGTKEVGERAHAGEAGGASIWFQWTAQREGSLTVWVNVPTFDTVMGVYTGTAVDALTEVASNDDYGSRAETTYRIAVDDDGGAMAVQTPLRRARKHFFPIPSCRVFTYLRRPRRAVSPFHLERRHDLVSGTTRIAVDGVGGADGQFRLRWRQGPVNDFFADAEVVAGLAGSVERLSFGATAEPGETIDLSAVSTWFRWTAPEDGSFGFHVRGAEGLTVYTGSSIGALTQVGETGSEVIFPALSGTQYSVRVARSNWNIDDPFTLFWGQSPANDSFDTATELAGPNGNTVGSTAFATLETGETAQGGNSVWYTWTAPATGHVRFDVWMTDEETWGWTDTILKVSTGATVDALTRVARNDDWYGRGLPEFGSAVSFRAVAGTDYVISVETWSSFSWGPFALRWYPGADRPSRNLHVSCSQY